MKRLLILALLPLLTGCISVRNFAYKADPAATTAALISDSATVLPSLDDRSNVNSDYTGFAMIPLVPFASMQADTPEQLPQMGGKFLIDNPQEIFARNLADELQSTRLFSESFFGYRRADARYLIQGTLKVTRYHAEVWTYGVSVLGVYLWFFGLPAGNYDTALSIEIECTDQSTGRSILKKTYDRSKAADWFWIYNMERAPNYDGMLKDINKTFIADLRAVLAPSGRK